MHKKALTSQAHTLVDDATKVANHLGEDGEEPIGDAISRPLVSRALKQLRCQIIARAVGCDADDVKTALAELAADAVAAAAEDDDEDAVADAS